VARRPYLGIVVPEEANDIDPDGLAAKVATKAILLGVSAKRMGANRVLKITDGRAHRLWHTIQVAHGALGKGPVTYQTEQ
jgi:hypothetical protein